MAGESYTTPSGRTVTVPVYTDSADAPVAFKDFADSLGEGGSIDLDSEREGQVIQGDGSDGWVAGMAFTISEDVPEDSVGEVGDVVFVLSDPKVEEPGLPGLGGWSDVISVTGATGNRYTYTDADGDWVAYEWTDDGSVTTAEGLVDVLIVSSGSSSPVLYSHGGGVIAGVMRMEAVPATIKVGAQVNDGYGNYSGIEQSTTHLRMGGSGAEVRIPNANGYAGYYSDSPQSNSRGGGAAGDAAVNTPGPGVISSIRDGNPVEYGRGGEPGVVPANTGQGNGALNGPSSAGVVIVRVPANHALATIPNTWGDL